MRIIAGKHKGRKLNTPNDQNIRPTSDRTREGIFNMLQWRIGGSTVLDLFAGTGAMGIEAISRGAKAVFNDADRKSTELIKINLALLKEQAEVMCADCITALAKLKGRRFDIIFLDPPYALDINEVFIKIREYGLLNDGGTAVYEHNNSDEKEFEGYRLIDSRRYGKAVVDCLEGI
jgi:16S rRNA (guanine(966)-N(2))-methyltransferase RsmD